MHSVIVGPTFELYAEALPSHRDALIEDGEHVVKMVLGLGWAVEQVPVDGVEV